MKTIFSRIINKEIPCHLILEDENTIAFMDINPIAIGHVLVVPKIEIDYLFDMEQNSYDLLWAFSKKIALALKKTIECKRIGVSVVGLEVPHVHIHLIPIKSINDMDFKNKINMSNVDLSEIAKKINFNL